MQKAVSNNKKQVKELLESLKKSSDGASLKKIAAFLDYRLFKNPIEPTSEWHLLSHPQLDDDAQSLMALKYDDELNEETTVRELRKKYEQIELQKKNFRGYDVYLYMFVGKGRLLIFKGYDSHRDERVDISPSSIEKVSLFVDVLFELKEHRLEVEEDEFGFGNKVVGLEKLFKRSLTNHFSLTIQLYRKKIAEMITSNKSLEDKIMKLLPEHEQKMLESQKMADKLLNADFKQAIGSVIDTIVLRVVLRRFLESYHGYSTFSKQDDFKDIGLGQREGKLEDVIDYLADIRYKIISERKLKSIVRNKDTGQMTMDLFNEVTHDVTIKETDVSFPEIHTRLRKQFELAYGGDLFSGDIARVVNEVEQEINMLDPELLLHLMVATSEKMFNFRYEDMPPEMIQDFYETSMGYSLRYFVNEDGTATVTYSDDLQERKHKGAYYTSSELVEYMINQTVGEKINSYISQLNKYIKEENKSKIFKSLDSIINLTVVDITCGGGSFLRGAFRYLASKRESIVRALEKINNDEFYSSTIKKFPYFKNDSEGESQWEKHILLRIVYGLDIDYKSLIISSQTLTLTALDKWQIGVNFPNLIGLTLMHENALMSPTRVSERKEAFAPFKEEIKYMIQLKDKIVKEQNVTISEKLMTELNNVRLAIQEELYGSVSHIIEEEYKEALMPQAIEINFPEVFFNSRGELKRDAGFSVSVGNPPWEVWKPNAEEFFEVYNSEYRGANRATKEKIKAEIIDKNPSVGTKWDWYQEYYEVGSNYYLRNDFYDFLRVKVDGRFTGGDINLYRVATERNYQILNNGGQCGYLVPSNIYTDRGSTGMRRMLFDNTNLKEIASFENRKGIFLDVHRSYKFAIVLFEKGGRTDTFRAFFYKTSLGALLNENNFINIPVELVKKMSPETYSVMEYREKTEVDLMKKLAKFPLLAETIDDKWNLHLYSEFHMTSDNYLFNEEEEGNPLLEGKSIWQFDSKFDVPNYHIESQKADEVLLRKEIGRIEKTLRNESGLTKKEANLKYFSSEAVPGNFPELHKNHYRLAFREIASSTNRRSLISTIVPKQTYLGNTLITAYPVKLVTNETSVYYKHQYNLKELLAIIGVLNTFVVDFIVRRKITTHLNIFYVYQLPIPRIVEGDKYFDGIMKRSAKLICVTPVFDELKEHAGISNGETDEKIRQEIQNQIDAYVAKIYGLKRDELLYLLSTFKSANHGDEMRRIAQGVIEQFDILESEGELICPK